MNEIQDNLAPAVGILTGLGLAVLFWVWAVLMMVAFTPDQQADFTDSGVGCIDDCLAMEDEVNTLISQERN